jgi:hemerythrin
LRARESSPFPDSMNRLNLKKDERALNTIKRNTKKLSRRRIEYQHRELRLLIARLREDEAGNCNDRQLVDVLTQINALMMSLFDDEQRLFDALSLPSSIAESHRRAHINIIEEMVQWQWGMMTGAKSRKEDLAALMQNLVNRHHEEHDVYLEALLEKISACKQLA